MITCNYKMLFMFILLSVTCFLPTHTKKFFINTTLCEATIIGITVPCIIYGGVYYYYIQTTSLATIINALHEQKLNGISYLSQLDTRSLPSEELVDKINETKKSLQYYLRLLKIKLFFSRSHDSYAHIISEYEDIIKKLPRL